MKTETKTIILTGCASGIGRHLAGVLASQGHRLIATDINEAALREQADSLGWPAARVLCRRLDVRSPEQWQEIVDLALSSFGQLDVLLNVAGYLLPGFIHETPIDQVDLHIDVNTKGVILGTRAAAVRMVRQGHGHIVNIASLAGVAPIPGLCLYSASKFAVRGFSLAAAQELRPHGVYVTVICPDAVQTPMLDLQLDYKEAAMTFSGKRALTVEDIERAVLGEALDRRPLEVVLPRSRGLLAKFASFLPGLAFRLGPGLVKAGLSRQATEKRRRPPGVG